MPVTAEHRLDHTRLRILTLAPGERHESASGPAEWILLPLAGSCRVTVTPATGPETVFELHGRESVFTALTDFAYLPRGARSRVESTAGGRFALAGAPGRSRRGAAGSTRPVRSRSRGARPVRG
ncbi:5-deoxy-glucuronate isomerase [Streptomyces sp. 12297]